MYSDSFRHIHNRKVAYQEQSCVHVGLGEVFMACSYQRRFLYVEQPDKIITKKKTCVSYTCDHTAQRSHYSENRLVATNLSNHLTA